MRDEGLELLTENECYRLAASVPVGRVIVVRGAAAAVFPVNFRLVGHDIIFTTGDGMKLRAASDHETVTFEVDAFDTEARTGWSVTMVGTAELATPAEQHHAEVLGLFPMAAGDRAHGVRVRPDMVSGRRIAVA